MNEMQCVLAIGNHGKAIPYPACDQEDGERNHGFRNLKGKSEAEILDVPEVTDLADLREFLVDCNRSTSAFFTVGCAHGAVPEGSYHWWSGYVEFSFADSILARNPQSYFKLFWDFSRLLWNPETNPQCKYSWLLETARFESIGVDGVTCTIYITSAAFETREAACATWAAGLTLLRKFLTSITWSKGGQPIY